MEQMNALSARLKKRELAIPLSFGDMYGVKTWSDKYLEGKVAAIKPLTHEGNVKNAYQDFCFYLFEDGTDCENVRDLVIRLALLAEGEDGTPLVKDWYAEEQASLKVDWGILVKTQENGGPSAGYLKEQGAALTALALNKTPPFLTAAWTDDRTPRGKTARRILSHFALFLTRMTVKTPEAMEKYWERSMMESIRALYPHRSSWVLPKLNNEKLKGIKSKMFKGEKKVMLLHYICVHAYLEASRNQKISLVSTLQAACLQHLHSNGIALIKLYFDALSATGLSSEKFLSCSQCVEPVRKTIVSKSVCNVSEFLETLVETNGGSELTWPWCRYLDDTQWTTIRVPRNEYLATMWAAVIDKQGNRAVWKLDSLSKIPPFIKGEALRWAEILLDRMKKFPST